MTARELLWRKSSYSTDNGNCVEVGRTSSETAVRDSKNPNGPTLTFGQADWQVFLHRVGR